MSSPWTPLLPIAMIGTERSTAFPAWPGQVGHLLGQLLSQPEDPARSLLRAAAVLGTCRLAGTQGVAWTDAVPPAASEDAWPVLPEGPLRQRLDWTLREGPARLQQQACHALARAGLCLPWSLLPRALELGRRDLALRTQIVRVIGERGRWLALQREEWRHAAEGSPQPDAERMWTEGSLDQRRSLLQQERAQAPGLARQRLQQALPELPARERADLVATLAVGLSDADEPLLDSLRADRSREVRQAALQLLVQLPNCAHATRAMDRVQALVRQERGWLRKHWHIDAPPAIGEDWTADNVDPVRPQHETLGERGWWLYQLVRQVPLAWWTQHTGLAPGELIRWAQDTDWAEALLRGWHDSLAASRDIPWCEALLDGWPAGVLPGDASTVLGWLPLRAREWHWQQQLKDGTEALPSLLAQVIAACEATDSLSALLSASLCSAVQRHVQGHGLSQAPALRTLLPELCCVLHADALGPLAALPREEAEPASCDETRQAVAQIIAVRQALQTLHPSSAP